jgi:hypothetical protein
MKIQIKLNGILVSREIPTSWNQVNFKMFLELQKCKSDFVKVMALFTGIEEKIIREAKIINLDDIILAVGFLKNEPVNSVPESILSYKIPKDLGYESIAQFEDIKDTLKKSSEMTIEQHLDNYPLYCAIYACNPYDWKKAEEMKDLFLNAPCQEVLGIGNFTLAKLIGLNFNTGQGFHPLVILLRNFRLALTVWRLRLAFIVRSFTWKKKQDISVKSF